MARTRSADLQRRILEAVDNDDIAFEFNGSRRSLRWWTSETESRTPTKLEREYVIFMRKTYLIRENYTVGSSSRGAYVLTRAGRRLLNELRGG